MKLSKRIVLSLITILMSIGIFAVSVDQARADVPLSTFCQLDKFLPDNEYQTDAKLGISCKNLDKQFIRLGDYIAANNDGTLAWQSNGNFQKSCADSFIENNHILKSTCKKTDGSRVDSQLDLDENFLAEGPTYVVYTRPSDSNGSINRIVLIIACKTCSDPWLRVENPLTQQPSDSRLTVKVK